MENPLKVQIGGDHYQHGEIQPMEFITRNQIEFALGSVVKRICRHDKKGGKGAQDIAKAIHELQLFYYFRYDKADDTEYLPTSLRPHAPGPKGKCKCSHG